jgi:hypothetical protein
MNIADQRKVNNRAVAATAQLAELRLWVVNCIDTEAASQRQVSE